MKQFKELLGYPTALKLFKKQDIRRETKRKHLGVLYLGTAVRQGFRCG